MKKPFDLTPVTMPVVSTSLPVHGEETPLPWIWLILNSVGTAFGGLPLLRGAGAPVEKSPPLSSVSWAPLLFRSAAVVFESVAVGPAPSKQVALAPKPTKSMMPALGHAPLNAAAPLTSATFPLVADIAMVPVASGGGRVVVPP